MAKLTVSPFASQLERARKTQREMRLVRSIPDVDVIDAYVIDVGTKWVLLAEVVEMRVDGYVAIRLEDVERVTPSNAHAFHRAALELAGVWPPSLPADAIDLTTTRGLLQTAHSYATLVNVQVEREDPDVAFIGVPTTWGPKKVWLEEVSPRAKWEDTYSVWSFSEITRVNFSGTYENDLLLVAGPPPQR